MQEIQAWAADAVQNPYVRALLIVVGAVVLAKIVDFVICRVVRGLTSRTQTDMDERLVDQLHRPIFLTVVLVGVRAAFAVLELPAGARGIVGSVISTIVVLVWAVAALRICSTLLTGLSRLSVRVSWLDSRTLPLFDNVAKLVILGAATYFLLVAWQLNIGAWLASAGVVGIAVSFAAKDSLAHLFGGLFVIADAPYKVGDFINLDSGERGRVVQIGLRSTRLMTRDDVEITVPNGVIANAKIVNESGGPGEATRVSVTVGVAYGSDVDRVRRVLTDAAQSVESVVADPEPRIRFTEMGDSALIWQVMCWIEEPVLRGRTIDALNTAIYKALGTAGISIPFPQRDVHLYRASEE